MVSFSCEGCGDVLTKKKLDQHRNRCHGSSYTCIDCMVDFYGTSYRSHTACMSEAQKYQGGLYQEKKKGNKKSNATQAVQTKQAYVEDADDEYSGKPFAVDSPGDYDETLPAAPSPPSAAPDFEPDGVNVFDFLDNSQTPNISRMPSRFDLGASEPPTPMVEDTPETNVRFQDPDTDEDEDVEFHDSAMVPYSTVNPEFENPISTYETPISSTRNKKESKSSDKKRKRLHVETQDLDASPARDSEDALMTDAPPMLHSGLTGGLKGLLARPSVFPPSPDYSGDAAEPDQSPGSPLKKTKHSKTSSKRKVTRGESIGNNLMSLITTGSLSSNKHADDLPRKKKSSSKTKDASADKEKKSKSKKDKKSSTSSDKTIKAIEPAAQKLLEFSKSEGAAAGEVGDEEKKVVLYQARAELFMSFVNKGPESEKGCSMNKAVKRYLRECESLGVVSGAKKGGEEKELLRSLRLRRNDRGEVVVFF